MVQEAQVALPDRNLGTKLITSAMGRNLTVIVEEKKKGKFDIAKFRCFNCNEKGHFQADCPEPSKWEKANLI